VEVPHVTTPSTTLRYVQVAPGSIELRTDGERRPLREGEARVRVVACGICGTDLHLWHGMVLPRGARYPVRPGHEISGRVIELGPGADGLSLGDLVVLHPLSPCGQCEACMTDREHICSRASVLGIHVPGGLADEVIWPARRMVSTNGLEPVGAAVLADAVATAHRAVSVADLPAGGSLCVLGAGGVGTHVLELVRLLNPTARLAAVVNSAPSQRRLEKRGFLTECGLDGVARRLRQRSGLFDVVADFSGSASGPTECLRMLRPGGTLLLGSVLDGDLATGPATTIQTRELTIRGVYASTMADLRAVVDLARTGGLDPSASVTHRATLADAARAFQDLQDRPAGLVRMVVTG
jgi:2-desacetyl-2-hydroxyethyl bacteriochlorophyllide A dehydrogenase